MNQGRNINSIGWDNMRKMIDLFSGFGGASEAFVQAGWQIMRCENNPDLLNVKDTWNWDLSNDEEIDTLIHMPYWDNCDLIWASPPCLEFSNAYHAPKPRALRSGIEFKPDLTLLHNALKIIKEKKPKYWVIENVAGASKIFSKEMGVNAPRQIVGPYFLWGNFPFISMPRDWEHKGKNNISGGNVPLRSNKKAIVDFEVSRALLQAITEQKQLTEWL